MKPKYRHNCSDCEFLGTDTVGSGSTVYDFYTCHADGSRLPRSLIARFGNKPDEYISGPLFCCAELTELDRLALYRGLELTELEEKKLLEVLAAMYRNGLSMKDYQKNGGNVAFGKGNIMFRDL